MALERVILFDENERYLSDLNVDTFDPTEIEGLDGESRLLFDYPLKENDVNLITEGCFIAIPDLDGTDEEYLLFEIAMLSQDDLLLHAECNHDYYNLAKGELVSWNTDADAPLLPLTASLEKERWQVGTVDITRALKRSQKNVNPLESLRYIEAEWGGELKFRITITGNYQISRYVDHLTRRGAFVGNRFEFGHNLEEFTYTTDTSGIYTAAYGFGKPVEQQTDADGQPIEGDPITFENVEWSVANGDPTDKPLGQIWVGDDNARLLYGRPDGNGGRLHKFMNYNDSEAETEEGLLWEAWRQVQLNNFPLINVTGKVVDLGSIDPKFSHEKARLGDDHFIIADVLGKPIELKARIIKFTRKRKDPTENEVEIGNFLPTASNELVDIQKKVDLIDAKAAQTPPIADPNATIDGSRIRGIIDGINAEFHSSLGYVYNDADGILVLNAPKDQNPTKAMFISGGAFFLSNSKNADGSWNWRTFGDGDGFIADELIAGTIRTDLVEIEGDTNFKWNGQNLYILDPTDSQKQIRIGKYDGTNYGIAFTKDGGATWNVALSHDGFNIKYTEVTGLTDQLDAKQTGIDEAKQAAATAQGTADTAKTDAANAQTAANAAQTDADTAQQTANQAKTDAANAQADADAAATAASNAQTAASNAQADADTANGAISDLSNDNKLTPTEKQLLKKDWDAIVAEKPTLDAQATTYAITTEKTNYDNMYTTLNTYISPLLTSLTTTSDIVGTDLRTNFKNYYDYRTKLLQKITDLAKSKADAAQSTADTAKTNAATAQDAANAAQAAADDAAQAAANAQTTADNAAGAASTAQQLANAAQTAADNAQADADAAQSTADTAKANAATAQTAAETAQSAASSAQSAADAAQQAANTANSSIADLSNDNKLTSTEKQMLKKEWDGIVAEKPTLDAQATTYGITTEKTNYDNNYNTLSSYITPLLADLTTTSDITGTTLRTNFKNYYDYRTKLLQKVTDLAKSKADAAQSTANTAKTDAATAQSAADAAQTAADNAQSTADQAKTAAGNAQSTADGASNAAIAAQSTADTAKANAATAQSAANAAQSAADAAQADADSAASAAATAQSAANAAQSAANSAQSSANTANNSIADLANDNKLSPLEKQSLKKEWDAIVSEKPTIDAQADTYAITTEKTTYGSAYSTLNTYITPLLADLTTTSTITGTTLRANFKAYYDARTALLKKVTDSAKAKADAANQAAANAQSAANTAQGAADDAQQTADDAVVNAGKAQDAADAALDKAIKVDLNSISRNGNLVTNGTGYLKDNTNFSSFVFDGKNAPDGMYGSFKNTGNGNTIMTDELMPIDPSQTYKISALVKSDTADHQFYVGLAPYDIDGNAISPAQYMHIKGTLTTLAQDLKDGDTVVKLTSAAAWGTTGLPAYNRGFIFWDYKNSYGYQYPAETYSRHTAYDSTNGLWDDGKVDTVNNTITLKAPWSGGTVVAGTQVSQSSMGSGFLYTAASNATYTTDWTLYSGFIQGFNTTGISNNNAFPFGTTAVKILILANRGTGTNTSYYANVQFTYQGAIDVLTTRVSDVEQSVTADSIISTVTTSEQFTAVMDGKANAADLGDYATQDALENAKKDMTDDVDAKIAAIDFEPYVTQGQLVQTSEDLTAKFSAGGGVNLLKNSIGFVGFDFWQTISGNISTRQNQELNDLGFGSGFYGEIGSGGYIEQEVNVVSGQSYTLSFLMRKTTDNTTNGAAGCSVYDANGSRLDFVGLDSGEGTNVGFEKYTYSFTALTGTVKIRVEIGSNSVATITGLMLNEGTVALHWTLATGELYNTNIKMDLNGIRVSRIEEEKEVGYTQITPEEFAGHYIDGEGNDEKIFYLNEDETVTKKMRAKDEITMGTIKIVKVNNERGSNLLSNTDFNNGLTSWRDWGTDTGTRSVQAISDLEGFSNALYVQGTTGGEFGKAQDSITLITDETYTLSVYAKITAGSGAVELQVGASGGNAYTQSNFNAWEYIGKGWVRFTHTFVATGTNTSIYFGQTSAVAGTVTAYFTGAKLERGSMATDWSKSLAEKGEKAMSGWAFVPTREVID